MSMEDFAQRINDDMAQARSGANVVEFAPTAAAGTSLAMTVSQQVVRCTTDGVSAGTISLPPVTEAKGKIYTIRLVSDGGTNITITDLGDSDDDISSVLTAVKDFVVFFSDGWSWYDIDEVTT